MNAHGRLPYIGALDGLRALAVTAVLLYHAGLPWSGMRFPGGFLGVDVFFVLSGYLITSLLLSEWRNRAGLDLGGFWLRRARRLLPAVLALLAVVFVYTTVFARGDVASLRGNVLASLGYVTNWYLIVHQESYFESWGRPSALRHLWSLAIEEQYYLLWPVALAIGLRVLRERGLFVALVIAAVVSTVLMALLYHRGADPSRVYYGTDTRAAGLLIGSALALVWAPVRPESGVLLARSLDALALAALALLASMALFLGESAPFLYRGGFLVAALATAAVVAAMVNRRSLLGPALAWGPLRWIGLRSYAIYLWHWPVFVYTRPEVDVPLSGLGLFAIRVAITLALAELSYRLVETPVRRGALVRGWRALRTIEAPAPRLASAGVAVCLATVAVTLVVSAWRASPEVPSYLSARVEQPVLPANEPPPASGRGPGAPVDEPPTAVPAVAVATPTAQPEPPDSAATPAPCRAGRPCATDAPPPPAAPTASVAGQPALRITAIGDSVMLGAAQQLAAALPKLQVYAEVGLQASAGIEQIRALKTNGQLGEIVVVHLGNNGTFSASSFDALMALLADRKLVVVVNVNVPRDWEGPNNAMLAAKTGDYRNAVLVDWHAQSDRHSEYFWDDRVHLRPLGADVYATLIAQAVARPAPIPAGSIAGQ